MLSLLELPALLRPALALAHLLSSFSLLLRRASFGEDRALSSLWLFRPGVRQLWLCLHLFSLGFFSFWQDGPASSSFHLDPFHMLLLQDLSYHLTYLISHWNHRSLEFATRSHFMTLHFVYLLVYSLLFSYFSHFPILSSTISIWLNALLII